MQDKFYKNIYEKARILNNQNKLRDLFVQ
jgi:hypothetical protein